VDILLTLGWLRRFLDALGDTNDMFWMFNQNHPGGRM
jgi:hypothetical protein